MTEEEWLQCPIPQKMLLFLGEKATARKLRLFACACCRRIWRLLQDRRAQDALEVAEQFADQFVGDDERSNARKAAQQAAQSRAVTSQPTAPKWQRRAASAVYHALSRQAWQGANDGCQLAAEALVREAGGYAALDWQKVERTEESFQANLLRDLFGNPYRPVPCLPPEVLIWNSGLVEKLARAVYEQRNLPSGTLDTNRLAVLADALEEAGCTERTLIEHCVGPGPHYRGCWAVDHLLNKE
jgi:hypothetical protein